MYTRAFIVSFFGAVVAFAQSAAIRVDAGKVLHRITPYYIGTNLEDLNYQCYGGLYSQLIHGESFQEHVDSAVLGLTGKQRLKVYIGESDTGEVQVWGIRTRQWEHNGAREALGLPLKPEEAMPQFGVRPAGIPVSLEELPVDKRQALLAATTPESRVSRQWRSVENGSAKGTFGFERKAPFIGVQSQIVTFVSGSGEVGIENAGLNRWGINLVGGNPYEGILRIRTQAPSTIFVSLLDSTGSKKLAEKALTLRPGNEYQQIEFTLTPSSNDETGHFAVSLKAPGSVTVGYAFLQPGPWGRFQNLPIRKDLAQAIIDQGVKVIRYNGSMVSRTPDGQLLKWKEMIGPRDLRKPYRGNFNVYASNGFGIFDFLNFAEPAGVLPIPGIRIDETPEDMADFLEYVNGPATSPWGKRRAADGHPAPYGLKHLEIGNEHAMDEAYSERFEILAKAIWAREPGMILLVSHNLGQDPKVWEVGPAGEVSDRLKNAARLVRFAQERKGVIWWDHHYGAQPRDYEQPGPAASVAIMATFKGSIDKLVPGANLPMAPLEENGPIHNMARALAHARNLNAFFDMGGLQAVAVANTLEAWQQDLVWDQGRTVFTPSKTIPQPPYYVDQVIARNWAPNVVQTTVDGPLDATARTTEDGRALVLHIVNDKSQPVDASLAIVGFELSPKAALVTELTGDADAINTPEDPGKVRPQTRNWNHGVRNGLARYVFPARSVTLLRFER